MKTKPPYLCISSVLCPSHSFARFHAQGAMLTGAHTLVEAIPNDLCVRKK